MLRRQAADAFKHSFSSHVSPAEAGTPCVQVPPALRGRGHRSAMSLPLVARPPMLNTYGRGPGYPEFSYPEFSLTAGASRKRRDRMNSGYVFSVGGTGDPPVPSGDPPDGTGRSAARTRMSWLHMGLSPV